MELYRKPLKKYLLYLLIAGGLIYLSFLGRVHLFDWDEINFAECAREMILLNNYLSIHIDFEPFWEKPPFFFWLQSISMKLFGIGEWAARFPNALLGLFTLPALYYVGSKLKGHGFGLNWALLYACSFLPLFYFKSGIIDPWFNAFIFSSYFGMYLFIQKKKAWLLYVSGLCLGLAILTKGPVALLLILICGLIISIFYRKLPISVRELIIWSALVTSIPGLWFLLEYIINGPYFITEFIQYQIRLLTTEDAGHGGFPGYHFVIVLLGCFPASVVALPKLFQRLKKEEDVLWMQILLWVVLILFSLVQSKIVHYSSLAYFPLTYLAAQSIFESDFKFSLWQKAFLVTITSIWLVTAAIIPILMPDILEYLDPAMLSQSAVAVLSMEVEWPNWLALSGLLLLAPWVIFRSGIRVEMKKVLIAASYILFIQTLLFFYIPRIETYTQGPAIEFYKRKQEENCYVENWGFKTYADMFYTRKQKSEKLPVTLVDAIENGVDKRLYIVTKIYRREKLENTFPELELLYEKGEFAFYLREGRQQE